MRLLIVERCVETVQACAPPILCTHRSHTHTHTHTYTNTHALRSGSLANSTTVYLAYVPNSPYLLTLR